MNGDDGLYLLAAMRLDAFPKPGRGEVKRAGIDIREEDAGAEPRDASGRCEKGVGRGDHGVPRPDPERHEDRQFRVGT
jgi:hypothetical protein